MVSPTFLPLLATDFDSIKAELIARAKQVFPDWSDLQESNNMIMLLELFAGIQEQNMVYLDRRAREAYLQYAQDPENVVALAWGLGYTPKYQTPSTVEAQLTVSPQFQGSTPILAGTKFATTDSDIFYEVSESFSFPAGVDTYGPVVLKQQETWNITGVGDGGTNQQLVLLKTPVMPDTVSLSVDGVPWTQIEHFVDSDSASQHYQVTCDLDGKATIKFGDGINGKAPGDGAVFNGTYKTGGGKVGTIGANQLGDCVTVVVDSYSGQAVSLSATNTVAATPGEDRESTAQIKVHARSNLKASRVLLSLEDVEDFVAQLSGVEAVKAINWLTVPSLPHHIVQIYVAPLGAALNGGAPSATLLARVENQVTQVKPLVLGTIPQVLGPVYKELHYALQVGVQSGYAATDVGNRVTAMLRSLFDPTVENKWGFTPAFGQQVYKSQLVMILQQVEGVRNIDITSPGDLLLQPYEYPLLKEVTVNFS